MFTFPGCWRGDRMDKGPEVGCLTLAGDQREGGVLGRGRCEDEKAWTFRAQHLRKAQEQNGTSCVGTAFLHCPRDTSSDSNSRVSASLWLCLPREFRDKRVEHSCGEGWRSRT